jgi:hypothetical protein
VTRGVDNHVVNSDQTIAVTINVVDAQSDNEYDAVAMQSFNALIRDDDRPLDPDFNGDDRVDGSDFLTWQRGLGAAAGAAHAQGDADADGDVDASDLVVWRSRFGAGAASQPTADFNHDTHIDGLDLAAWRGGFGVAAGAQSTQGDADLDGDVDGADFLQWQRTMVLSAAVAVSEAARFEESRIVDAAAIEPLILLSASTQEISALAGAMELHLAPGSDIHSTTSADHAAPIPAPISAASRDGVFASLGASMLIAVAPPRRNEDHNEREPCRRCIMARIAENRFHGNLRSDRVARDAKSLKRSLPLNFPRNWLNANVQTYMKSLTTRPKLPSDAAESRRAERYRCALVVMCTPPSSVFPNPLQN